MQTVDALTVSVVVDDSSDMLSTPPPHITSELRVLHLVYPNEDLIDATITEFKKFGFRLIITGHCRGWRAVHAFADVFGSDTVDPLAVGTQQFL
jgi:7,8-dihydropterin-6-yl-methyl-4-(beta-D-ribofuranosyl)aminobenzene 5'-phosphate synthase